LYNLESNGETYAYSTVSDLNSEFANNVVSVSSSVLPVDNNGDGKYDNFEFLIQYFVPNSESTISSQLYLFFQYAFDNKAKFIMQDYIRIDLNNPNGIQKAYVTGNIELYQRGGLQSSALTRNIYNISLFDNPTQNINALSLQQNHFQRNESIYCNCESTTMPFTGSGNVEYYINLRVPIQQTVVYVPSILENLKFSWIQYLSLLIPAYLICERVIHFAFKNKIFEAQETNDIQKKRD